MRRYHETFRLWEYLLFAVVTLAVLCLCVCIGSVRVPLGDTLAFFAAKLTGGALPEGLVSSIMPIRLPRVLCVALTGAALSLAGAAMQGLLKNPLADGSTLGVDVDGTLVSFETHKVLPSSVDALRKIHDGGIRIVIATGRAAGDLHEIADVPYDGIIALNGADCVLRDGTVIRKHLIPKDDFKKAMEIAKTFDFAVAIELDEGVFAFR